MDELSKKLLARTIAIQSNNFDQKLPPLKKTDESNNSKSIDCRKCIYFFITWKKGIPYGCKAYGFESAQIPSIVVKSSSGEKCSFFKQRL